MTNEEINERAAEWLRNYHGSIDSTALLLAFKAGYGVGAAEAYENVARELEGYQGSSYGALKKIADRVRALKDRLSAG